jgi:nucleotide-binding universal stress UspA family protein
MTVIEISLFIDKPDARRFALSIVTIGLILRMLVVEQRQRQWAEKKIKLRHASLFTDDSRAPLHQGAMLCAVRSIGKTLNFAIQEAKNNHQPLYILFIREQKVITEEDRHRLWVDDEEACKIFDHAKDEANQVEMKFFYRVSDAPAQTIVKMSKDLQISRLIMGRPRHSVMLQLLRGNVVQEISDILPSEIDMLVIS